MKYRKVSPAIWNDAKFRELDDHAKLVFFLLLTHPEMSALGAMRATPQGLAIELGWQHAKLKRALKQIQNCGVVIYFDAFGIVWLPNFLRYNSPESPNVVKAWQGALEALPEGDVRDRVAEKAVECAEGLSQACQEALKQAFAKPSRKGSQEKPEHPSPNLEPEQEQEQLKSVPTANAVGVPGGTRAAGPASIPNCPHEQIIALYHEILPACPRVLEWNEMRQGYLRSRWREKAKPNGTTQGYATIEAGLGYWRRFFEWVSRSDFLTGQADGKPGKPPFVADLEWLLRPTNFAKVIEGKYHDREAQAA